MKEDLNNMTIEESIRYIRGTRGYLEGINSSDIKDVEFDYREREFVLLKDGRILAQDTAILDNVKELWMQSLFTIYAITNENEVICINNNESNVAKYINNNNYKYKKIVYTPLSLVGLTSEGDLRAIYAYEGEFAVDITRFSNVEDIQVMVDEKTNIEYILSKQVGESAYKLILVLDEFPNSELVSIL